MNKKKRYFLDDINQEEFNLICINSNCESYRLAYLLNMAFNSRFIKSKEEVYHKKYKVKFQSFEWNDRIKGVSCYLFSNRSLLVEDSGEKVGSLFDIPKTKELYLIEELIDVDYILKINSGINTVSLVKVMEKISEVSYFYQPNLSQINLDLIINF
tara:strand:+ start:288 stop:755 length:468 start_codon:yes stop_codon:yes gene_type:complete